MNDLSELKAAGLRQTIPLLLTLQAFKREPKPHMTRDEAYRALVAEGHVISITTMNRAIAQLEQAQLLARNVWQGRTIFEYKTGGAHDHLTCTSCGRIVEYRDTVMNELIAEAAQSRGFQLTSSTLLTEGLCPACRHAGRRPRPG